MTLSGGPTKALIIIHLDFFRSGQGISVGHMWYKPSLVPGNSAPFEPEPISTLGTFQHQTKSSRPFSSSEHLVASAVEWAVCTCLERCQWRQNSPLQPTCLPPPPPPGRLVEENTLQAAASMGAGCQCGLPVNDGNMLVHVDAEGIFGTEGSHMLQRHIS